MDNSFPKGCIYQQWSRGTGELKKELLSHSHNGLDDARDGWA